MQCRTRWRNCSEGAVLRIPSDSDRVRDNDRDRDKVIDKNRLTQRDNHTDNKIIKL